MTKDIYFYKFLVNTTVFYKSKHTYALVNLKPFAPGHVLVVPYNPEVRRFADLSPDESIDYMNTLQYIHKFILFAYKADALNIAIQDGPESGQSIPHLHTHIIPRYKSDKFGDEIHQKVDDSTLNDDYTEFFKRRESFLNSEKQEFATDDQREPRTLKVMEKETNWLKEKLSEFDSL